MLNVFSAATKLLDPKNSAQRIHEKLDYFFLDFGIMPLFVQENYLQAYGHTTNASDIANMANAAEFISLGDSIGANVVKQQQWSLLPNLGLMSCVAPTVLNKKGYITFVPFPMIMGKMSTMRKITRLIKEIKEFCGPNVYANRNATLTEYLPLIFQLIFQ